jgi:hypothetical protein
MFDQGSEVIAIEPIEPPKICSGDPGAESRPSAAAEIRSSVPSAFHASTAPRWRDKFLAVAIINGIAITPT